MSIIGKSKESSSVVDRVWEEIWEGGGGKRLVATCPKTKLQWLYNSEYMKKTYWTFKKASFEIGLKKIVKVTIPVIAQLLSWN